MNVARLLNDRIEEVRRFVSLVVAFSYGRLGRRLHRRSTSMNRPLLAAKMRKDPALKLLHMKRIFALRRRYKNTAKNSGGRLRAVQRRFLRRRVELRRGQKREQRGSFRLPSHMWHAKRFVMKKIILPDIVLDDSKTFSFKMRSVVVPCHSFMKKRRRLLRALSGSVGLGIVVSEASHCTCFQLSLRVTDCKSIGDQFQDIANFLVTHLRIRWQVLAGEENKCGFTGEYDVRDFTVKDDSQIRVLSTVDVLLFTISVPMGKNKIVVLCVPSHVAPVVARELSTCRTDTNLDWSVASLWSSASPLKPANLHLPHRVTGVSLIYTAFSGTTPPSSLQKVLRNSVRTSKNIADGSVVCTTVSKYYPLKVLLIGVTHPVTFGVVAVVTLITCPRRGGKRERSEQVQNKPAISAKPCNISLKLIDKQHFLAAKRTFLRLARNSSGRKKSVVSIVAGTTEWSLLVDSVQGAAPLQSNISLQGAEAKGLGGPNSQYQWKIITLQDRVTRIINYVKQNKESSKSLSRVLRDRQFRQLSDDVLTVPSESFPCSCDCYCGKLSNQYAWEIWDSLGFLARYERSLLYSVQELHPAKKKLSEKIVNALTYLRFIYKTFSICVVNGGTIIERVLFFKAKKHGWRSKLLLGAPIFALKTTAPVDCADKMSNESSSARHLTPVGYLTSMFYNELNGDIKIAFKANEDAFENNNLYISPAAPWFASENIKLSEKMVISVSECYLNRYFFCIDIKE